MLPTDRPLRVLVLGAGLMGAQIGCEYALGGHRVLLVARRRRRMLEHVDRAFATLERYDLRSADEAEAGRGRLAFAAALDDATDADLVVESLPESFDLKAELLGAAAARFPTAILATNTSSLSVTRLGEAIAAPERTLGTHYWNPPLLMPLVELVAGDTTDASVVAAVEGLLRELRKRPVPARDVPGFVWNRLQLALLREAIWIVEHGVAGPETVDEVVRSGLARRWRLTGPFETVALGGAGVFERVAANLFPVLSDARAAAGLARLLPADRAHLETVRERRDAGLAGELRSDLEGGDDSPDRVRPPGHSRRR